MAQVISTVIKYGGSALEKVEAAHRFAHDVAAATRAGHRIVVVHGGGKELTSWMERLALSPRFVEGLRYTDLPTLEIAEMVLSGKANKLIAAYLGAAGAPAVGLSARDGNICIAERIRSPQGHDLGLVGEVVRVDTTPLEALLHAGIVPVISPIASDGNAGALNCNADHIASILSISLKCERLILLTDVDGIRCEGRRVERMSVQQGRELLSHPDIQGGMRPKLEYALRAVESGVRSAVISNAAAPECTARLLSGQAGGTEIYREEIS